MQQDNMEVKRLSLKELSADELLRIRKSASYFVELFLRDPTDPRRPLKLYDYQREVLDYPGKKVVIRGGRGVSKTTMMAWKALHRAFTIPRHVIIYLAQSETMLLRFFTDYLDRFITDSPLSKSKVAYRKQPQYEIVLSNESKILGFVGNSTQTIRGPRAGTILIDECFHGMTKVLTQRGLTPISRVRDGDYVLDADSKWVRVVRAAMTGVKEMWVIELPISDEKLVVTSNHPVLTKDSGFQPLDTVDEIPISCRYYEPFEYPKEAALALIYARYISERESLVFNNEGVRLIMSGYPRFRTFYERFTAGRHINPVLIEKDFIDGKIDQRLFVYYLAAFVNRFPKIVIDYLTGLGYKVIAGSLASDDVPRYEKEIGFPFFESGWSTIVKLADKLNRDPVELYKEMNWYNTGIFVPYKKKSTIRAAAYNLTTESGTYCVFIGGFRIPVHNCDYIPERKFVEVFGTTMSMEDVVIWLSSTPSPKRGYFWRACNDERMGFKEFHLPSWLHPTWTWMKDAERLGIPIEETTEYQTRVEFPNQADWLREIAAEFVDLEESAIPSKYIDEAFQRYDGEVSRKRGFRILGVDWNAMAAGVVMVLVEYDNKNNVFRVIHSETISNVEYHHQKALQRIVEMVKQYRIDAIAADWGYGESDIQQLQLIGRAKGIRALTDIMAVKFNEKMKIPLFSGGYDECYAKEYLMRLVRKLFEMGAIMLPPSEDERLPENYADATNMLGYQLRNLRAKVTGTGHLTYVVEPDHKFAAFLAAVYGFYRTFQPRIDPVQGLIIYNDLERQEQKLDHVPSITLQPKKTQRFVHRVTNRYKPIRTV